MSKKSRRVRRSAAEWSEIVQSWKASGETAEEYASRHGLNAGTLGWWRSQLSKQSDHAEGSRPRGGVGRKKPTSSFAEVVVRSPTAVESPLEVVAPSGYRVVVRGRVDSASLRIVLQVLSTC